MHYRVFNLHQMFTWKNFKWRIFIMFSSLFSFINNVNFFNFKLHHLLSHSSSAMFSRHLVWDLAPPTVYFNELTSCICSTTWHSVLLFLLIFWILCLILLDGRLTVVPVALDSYQNTFSYFGSRRNWGGLRHSDGYWIKSLILIRAEKELKKS